jgi:hypothetical protein
VTREMSKKEVKAESAPEMKDNVGESEVSASDAEVKTRKTPKEREYETVDMPSPDLLPGYVYVNLERKIDLGRDTFFPIGPELRKELVRQTYTRALRLHVWQRGAKLEFVCLFCGHIISKYDPHPICRVCDIAAVRVICHDGRECHVCYELGDKIYGHPTVLRNRRDRAGSPSCRNR